MSKTSYEKGEERGVEKGIEKGIEKGRRDLLREMIEDRFGTLSSNAVQRLQQLPLAELNHLRKALTTAQSVRDLGLEE